MLHSNIIFICCSAFGFDNPPTILNVINWGVLDNGIVSFETKEGRQRKTIHQIKVNGFIETFTPDQIDIKKSLYYYFQKWNYYPDTLIEDQELKIGEIYDQTLWHLKIMLEQDGKTLRYKLIIPQ